MVGALLAVLLGLGAVAAGDADARTPLPQCSDDIDNDGDGRTDFPFEPGCSAFDDTSEPDPAVRPACSNGVSTNNAADDDIVIDFPGDPGCTSAGDNNEANPVVLPDCADGADNDGRPTAGPTGRPIRDAAGLPRRARLTVRAPTASTTTATGSSTSTRAIRSARRPTTTARGCHRNAPTVSTTTATDSPT